jgi:PAS domain-containing protein
MRAERGKRVLGLARARRHADVSAAQRKRVVEQQPRERIVVDDEQAQLAIVRHSLVGFEARHSLLIQCGVAAIETQHNSGLYDGRLLGELLETGVVVLDAEQRCRYANPRACAHLGEADEASLVEGWNAIRSALDLGDMSALQAGDAPLQRRRDVSTAAGTRKLRYEVHAVDSGSAARYLILLRDRALIGEADRVQLLASECEANRHIIASLVHDAKGPLNNLHLTLALLTSALAQSKGSDGAAETLARCHRYVDVMQTQEPRLADCLNHIHALAYRADATAELVDVGALLANVAHVLRHEARLHEAKLQLDAATSAWTLADPHRLKLALFAFCACLVRASRPTSVITLGAIADGDAVRISMLGTGIDVPPGIGAALYRISGTAASDFQAVFAGRTIIEADGGELTLVDDGSVTGFSIRLPE